jgi:HEAT repeat protein
MATSPSAESIFFAALEKQDPAERAAYLDEACQGDSELRRRVERLLQAHPQVGSFLQEPLVDRPAGEALGPGEGVPAAGPRPRGEDQAHDTASAGPGAVPDFLTPSGKPGSLGRLDHYEVLEVVGRGGMGVVLKGFDEKLHRVVAIKVLAAELALSGTSRQRFTREARTAAAVSHEHVVTIHAVEEDHQPPYLVMQFIDGVSLQEKLDRDGPPGLKEVLRIGLQTAEGLAAAHRQGLVHRDIKPANILLENGVERVKITDFGLARAVDDASLTQSGVIAGTPLYMSPEQARGEAVDHRSDLFSLGSVLYALCTGRPPFRAAGTHAVLKSVIDDTPRPIQEASPEVPGWLCDLIARLHAKSPADRFQSARDVAELLGQHLACLQQSGPTALPRAVPKLPSAGPVRKRRWVRPVARCLLLLAFCGALFLAYLAGRLSRPGGPEPGSAEAPPATSGPEDSRPVPVYQGRPASAWVRELDDNDTKVRSKAYQALVAMGKEGVPYLITAVQKGTVKGQVLAAEALGTVGPEAGAAVGALRKLLHAENDRARVAAAGALWKVTQDSEAVLETLIGGLSARDREARQAAAEALAAMGPKARAALPALHKMLTDEDRKVRKAAVLALGSIGPKDVIRAPLSGVLKDTDGDVRVSAAVILRKIDPEAKDPVLVLVKAASDLYQRSTAREALEKVGPEAGSAVSDLARLLKDESEDVRKAATVTLGKIGAGARSAAPALFEALADPRIALDAEEALKRIDPEPASMLGVFTSVLARDRENSGSVYLGSTVERVLQKIGPMDASLVPGLLKMVTSMKIENGLVDGVLADAFTALGRVGPKAVSALRTALKHDDVRVRVEAARALWRIAHDAREVLPVLRKGLQSDHASARFAAAAALGDMGGEAREALPELRELLKDQSPYAKYIKAAADGAIRKVQAQAPESRKEKGRP